MLQNGDSVLTQTLLFYFSEICNLTYLAAIRFLVTFGRLTCLRNKADCLKWSDSRVAITTVPSHDKYFVSPAISTDKFLTFYLSFARNAFIANMSNELTFSWQTKKTVKNIIPISLINACIVNTSMAEWLLVLLHIHMETLFLLWGIFFSRVTQT